jgi:sulfate permease, SulP family
MPCVVLPGRQDADIDYAQSLSSPRITQMQDAGIRTLSDLLPTIEEDTEPFKTVSRVFSSHGEASPEQLQILCGYLERVSIPEGHVLWRQGEPSDGLYIIESGVLRASYRFGNHAPIEESMVSGTIAGELSALSNTPRNATATVERAGILWRLSLENLRRLENEHPVVSRIFTKLVLKCMLFSSTSQLVLTDFSAAAKTDHDILLAALASRH